MHIELAQLTGQDGNIENNLQSALQAIAGCAPQTDLIVFPETHLTGFPTKDNVSALAQPLDGPAMTAVHQAARQHNLSVVIGIAEARDGRYFNTTVLMTPDGIAMAYRKTHLWASDRGIFQPGDAMVTCEWKGLRVGLLICYDIEFPETARALAAMGADLVLVTNGNMDPYGPVHRNAIIARAMENQTFAVMVNRCGTDGGLTFAGGSAVVDPSGQVVHECGREPIQVGVELDLDLLQQSRNSYHYVADCRIGLAGEIREREFGVREFRIGNQ
jgi:(R)-amidase